MAFSPTVRPCAVDEAARTGIPAPAARETRRSTVVTDNQFHPDWDQIKPFNDRIAELEKVAKQALEHVQEFKRRWWQVPAFGNKVNKATREAITNAHSPIFELEHALRAALAEQPAQQEPVIDKSAAIRIATALGWEPKREWVGLTDEERKSIREWQRIQEELGPVWAPMMLYLYEAVEAELKGKNT